MEKSLKDSIVEHLNKKGNYESEVDDYLIDTLIENITYLKAMKQRLDEEGCVIETPNGNGIVTTKMNPAFGIYQMCLRNINQVSSKLGLNRADRLRLKILEDQVNNEFEKF
jgi:P27 family predicted phage terminase small subunit